MKLKDSQKWKQKGEKEGNKVWTMEEEESGGRAVKGECKIPFKPATVFYKLTDISEESQNPDSIMNTIRLLEKVGQNTYIMYG